jgi:hypothetical protein
LVSPYGGRKIVGVPPPADWIALWVRDSSEDICAELRVSMCGWV